ncbi:MAG: hypothetical protein QM640_04935 [Niabella sp.]
MKQYLYKISALQAIAFAVLFTTLYSCKKDADGANLSSASDKMVIEAVSVDSAANGAVIYVTGTGLGGISTITFSNNNIPAAVVPTLNTSTSVVFSVPDTAWGGEQYIVFTNTKGVKDSIDFIVLAYPTITAVSRGYDFITGTIDTLTGTNLGDVTSVKLSGTSDYATIISQTQKQLIIEMPATSVSRASLEVTNATGTSTTTFELVSVENALVIYDDALENSFQSWSWGTDNINLSNASDKICGSYSLDAGWSSSWGGLQLGGGTIDLTDMTYFSFYAKGSSVDQVYKIWFNWTTYVEVTVPADEWTYFKYKVSDVASGITSLTNFTIQIEGDAVTGNYWDDIMFFK